MSLAIEFAFADFRAERLPGMARQLLANGAELLYGIGQEAALAAARATASVPIVFIDVSCPLEVGLIDCDARQGRKATGVGFEVRLFEVNSPKKVDAAPAATLEWLAQVLQAG